MDPVTVVMDEIGFGRWQGLVVLVASLTQMIGPVQQLSSPLLSASVPFRCFRSEYNLALSFTRDMDNEYPSECLQIASSTQYEVESSTGHDFSKGINNSSLPQVTATFLASCPIVEYDTSVFQSTVITEWNLVCEASILRPLFQMAFSLGAILGSLFSGQVSDRLGRKRALQIGNLMVMASVVTATLVPWYSVVICMRVVSGMGAITSLFPSYTIVSEMSPTKLRAVIAMIPGVMYCVGQVIFAGEAYIVTDWRKLLLLGNAPLLLVVPLSFMIDESPRWLLQRGREEEAIRILKRGAQLNKVGYRLAMTSQIDMITQVKEQVKEPESDNVAKLGTLAMLKICLSSPGMRLILLTVSSLWFLLRIIYVGIVINANNFTSSNPIAYVGITGVVSLAAITLCMPANAVFPRRALLIPSLIISGLLMLLELVIPEEFIWTRWAFVMASFYFATTAFQANYAYGNELFPTVIRTRCFTATNLIGATGEMAIPIVTEILVGYASWAPSVTFGLAGIAGSLLVLLLPETKDRPLPDTLHDVESRYHDQHETNSKSQKDIKL